MSKKGLNIVGLICGLISIFVAILCLISVEDLDATVCTLKLIVAFTALLNGGLLVRFYIDEIKD